LKKSLARYIGAFRLFDYGANLTPSAILAADFNGDGQNDLATANIASSTVSVILGNGDGTFQSPLTSNTSFYSTSMQSGDLNSDGVLDLVAFGPFELRVLMGNGDGTFQASIAVDLPRQSPSLNLEYLPPQSQSPISVAVGDLNADGALDLIVGGEIVYPLYYQFEHYGWERETFVNALLGNSDGSFQVGSVTNVGGREPNLLSGDFNNDSRFDIVLNGGLLPGNGDGTFGAIVSSTIWIDPSYQFANTSNPANDLNDDGNLDVLSGPYLFLGRGDGSFETGAYVGSGSQGAQQRSVSGDVNRDGVLDIVLVDSEFALNYDEEGYWHNPVTTRWVRVRLGEGNNSYAPPILLNLGDVPRFSNFVYPILADFNGDDAPDLAMSEFFLYDSMLPAYHQGLYVALNDQVWVSPPPTITIDDVTFTEGNTGVREATFTVYLSYSSTQPITVAYANGNATATAGSDYQAKSGILTIPAGQTSSIISVNILGDRLAELDEAFFIDLTNATNATIADHQGIATIMDDEPKISISDVSKAEGKKGQTTLFTFTVTLSAAYDQPVTMSYRTANGTASTSNSDYVAKTGTLTFAPGETTKTIVIQVKGDSKREGSETFYLDLFGNSGNSKLKKSRGLATILNDD
jgi:Calx-beta domain/FG-GAP-like repeat